MHWHISRFGAIPSWAWTARTRRAGQALVTNLNRTARRRSGYELVRCEDRDCALYREWLSSLGPESPAPAYHHQGAA